MIKLIIVLMLMCLLLMVIYHVIKNKTTKDKSTILINHANSSKPKLTEQKAIDIWSKQTGHKVMMERSIEQPGKTQIMLFKNGILAKYYVELFYVNSIENIIHFLNSYTLGDMCSLEDIEKIYLSTAEIESEAS